MASTIAARLCLLETVKRNLIMPRLTKKLAGTSLASAAVVIAGCAALTSSWEHYVEEATPSTAYLFSHTDGKSFYKLTYRNYTSQATLQRIDLDGNLLEENYIPLFANLTSHLSIYSSKDSNEILFFEKDFEDIFLYDPESKTVLSRPNLDFLEDNQELELHSRSVRPDGSLLFSGYLITDSDLSNKQAVIGIMERDGEMSYFSVLPTTQQLTLYQIPGSSNYLLHGRYTNEHADQTGMKAFLKTVSATMEELTSAELEDRIHIRQLLNDRFLGYRQPSGGIFDDGIFDLSGNKIEEIPEPSYERYNSHSSLMGDDHYYRVGTITKEIFNSGDGYLIISEERLNVCQYNFNFEKNWCQTSAPAFAFNRIQAKMVNGNELAVSFSAFNKDIVNVDFSLMGNDLTFLADLDLRGKSQNQAHHWLLTEDGKYRIKIAESPFYYTGPASYDSLWNLDIQQEDVHPGVYSPLASLFLPEDKVITYSSYYSGGFSISTTKLTLWEK